MEINQAFLRLVEAFYSAADLSTPQHLSVLHTAYARANEIADLRLHGYEPQASHLETWDPATLLMNNMP